eukprot:TCALIF_05968-PA protein Name:"Similar to UBA6 Ubiquitin-like modifier-activating enzyme 6 (Homo sapiens)" AED:0.31 eAED:0.31 QI:0/0.66/0.4/0.9/0.55/0.7/10/0/684
MSSYLTRIYGSSGEKRLHCSRVLVLGKISPVNDLSHTLKFYEHLVWVASSLQLSWVGLEHATWDWISSVEHGFTAVEPYSKHDYTVLNLAQINVIIYLEASTKKAIQLNEACRQAKSVAFIWATSSTDNSGLTSLFVDPGLNRFSINPDGFCRQDSRAVLVGSTTKTSPPLVACNIAHGLESGQKVRICGENFITEVVSNKEFYAIQIQSGSEEKRVRRAISGQAILKVQSVADDEEHSFLGNHLAFLGEAFPEIARSDVLDKLTKTCQRKATLTGEISTWKGPVSVKYGFLASQICHQILNLCSLRYPPLKQWSHFKCPIVTSTCQTPSTRVAICGLGIASVALVEAIVRNCQNWVSKVFLCGNQVVQDDLVANANPNIFKKADIGKSSIVPHRTESYNCIPTPIEPTFPFCVIKSFPQTHEHAIAWATSKVESLFETKPEIFNDFWKTYGDALDDLAEGQMPQECLLVKKVLNEWQCTSWNDCVILARNKFEKYFNHKALQLLVNFPSDVGNSTDSNFWAYPKQEPRPVTFDPTKDSHLKFVTELAKAFARMMNIHPLEETIATDVLKKVQVRPFISKSKTFVTDDSVSKEEAKSNESTLDHDIFNDPAKRTQFIKQLKAARLKTLDVSSLDVSTKDRLVFVFSQMRCEMYGMAKPEASEIFYTANQKCPCLPSMLSTLANL